MWNPPVVDEALQLRRSALGEAAELVAELVREGARTICFIKSRKAVELVARIVRELLGPELAERVAPYRAGYTPQQRRELEARLTSGELLAVDHHRRARARHRHRRARRGGVRDVPRHGRLAAPDVGARRPARARAGRLRRGRGRAGPVLLPPPRRVPRAPGRGGDRLARERADPPRPPAVRRARGSAGPDATPSSSARAGRPTPSCSSPTASSSSAAGSSSCATPRTTRPRACRCARPRATASRSSTPPAASCWARWRPSRAANTVHDGAIYLHLGRSYEVARARPRRRPRARRALRRQLVHPAQARDRHRDRAPARPPRRRWASR